jgi:hypothetical protein
MSEEQLPAETLLYVPFSPYVDAEKKLLSFGPMHDMGTKDKKPIYGRAVMGVDQYGRLYVATEMIDSQNRHVEFRDNAVTPEKGISTKFAARCDELAKAFQLAPRPK